MVRHPIAVAARRVLPVHAVEFPSFAHNVKRDGRNTLTQQQAWNVYENLISQPFVSFRDEPRELDTYFRRTSGRDEASPKRWTDDYLAAFADASGLVLITFDRALAARVPAALLLTP